MLNRRQWLGLASIIPMAFSSPRVFASVTDSGLANDTIAQDLKHYIQFGHKASGGEGDNASGAWIEEELQRAGYATQRSYLDLPYFTPEHSSLRVGETTVPLLPQAVVKQTPKRGIQAHISYAIVGSLDTVEIDLSSIEAGSIALIDLPQKPYSSSEDPLIEAIFKAAEKRGALAIALVTNGPTGEAVALNAPPHHPHFSVPVGIVSPADKAPLVQAARNRQNAQFTLTGKQGLRPAFNILGKRIVDPNAPTVILSTPRSGWLTCAAERAPGIGVWLDLLRWAAQQSWPFNLLVMATTGHEYENAGLLHQIATEFPKPENVPLWLLFGAGTATRHSVVQNGHVTIFDRPAEQRSILLTPSMNAQAREVLTNWDGWKDPRFTHQGGAGEVGSAMRAGYPHVIGFAGNNPFHHVASDTGGLVDAHIVRKVAHESRHFLRNLAQSLSHS